MSLFHQKYYKEDNMQLSARNVLKGTIKEIQDGPVTADVIVEIAPGLEVSSIISKKSRENLGLSVGKEVCVVIKASNVMVGIE